MIEEIRDGGTTYAIVIHSNYSPDGVEFFTPNEFSQQVGCMRHPPGHKIAPHHHKNVVRQVERTQEVLIIRKGKVKVDIYDQQDSHFDEVVLEEGDIILLANGGHGFEMIEETEMIEVKQGPYAGDDDKEYIGEKEEKSQ